MAYSFDNYDDALVIDGWEKGVADSPHSGLSDMRNINIISVPGESSVNFSTVINSSPNITSPVTVTGLSSNAISFTRTSCTSPLCSPSSTCLPSLPSFFSSVLLFSVLFLFPLFPFLPFPFLPFLFVPLFVLLLLYL